MKYKIVHKTIYEYGAFVNISHSMVYLKPRNLLSQNVLNFKLDIKPSVKEIDTRVDFYNNNIHSFTLQSPHNKLEVISTTEIEVYPKDTQLNFMSNITVETAIDKLKNDSIYRDELLDFMLPSTFVTWDEAIKSFAESCLNSSDTLIHYVQSLCGKIFNEFKYDPEFSTIHTPVKTVLLEKKGVCQDFSHLAIACFRSVGLAARYVSGYQETLPPPGKPKLQGTDASHAWIAVYIPDFGWYDYDPTNNFSPSERHITVAWGRDYEDVPPVKGVVLSYGKQSIKVEVDVIAIEYQ
jgi:transglutaminase-like putative cysteine protease